MLKFNRIVVSPVCSFLSIINSFVSFVVINSVVSYRNNTTILINAIRLKYDPRFVPSRISIGTFLKHFCNNNNDNNNNNLYDYDHECGVCVCVCDCDCLLPFISKHSPTKQTANEQRTCTYPNRIPSIVSYFPEAPSLFSLIKISTICCFISSIVNGEKLFYHHLKNDNGSAKPNLKGKRESPLPNSTKTLCTFFYQNFESRG